LGSCKISRETKPEIFEKITLSREISGLHSGKVFHKISGINNLKSFGDKLFFPINFLINFTFWRAFWKSRGYFFCKSELRIKHFVQL
jgi:hypothetical protein